MIVSSIRWFIIMLNIVILVISLCVVHSSVIINRYDDENCNLDVELTNEIASYRNITKLIREEVVNNGFGASVFDE